MKKSELPIYEGEKDSCLQCGRKFEEREVITVAGDKKIFCYSDAEGGCVLLYVATTATQVTGKPMRFRK